MVAAHRKDTHRVATLVNWDMRLSNVRASMKSDPSHPRCWFWRIEEKILVYMIRRYGSRPDPASRKSYGQEPSLDARISWLPTSSKPPISRERLERIKVLLEHICSANETAPDEHDLTGRRN